MKLIFDALLEEGKFLDSWKKADAVAVYKNENKNVTRKYRLIVLLLIFGKIFERIIFKDLFNYFFKNDLFIKCQSVWFLPDDSCI